MLLLLLLQLDLVEYLCLAQVQTLLEDLYARDEPIERTVQSPIVVLQLRLYRTALQHYLRVVAQVDQLLVLLGGLTLTLTLSG